MIELKILKQFFFFFRNILATNECVDLKKKSCSILSKKDLKMFVQSKPSMHSSWQIDINSLFTCASDVTISNLIQNFFIKMKNILVDESFYNSCEYNNPHQQKLLLMAHNCLINDKMHEFSVGIALLSVSCFVSDKFCLKYIHLYYVNINNDS